MWRPRVYTKWDFGRAEGFCIDWLGATFQVYTKKDSPW
jgi:hypothetical protein